MRPRPERQSPRWHGDSAKGTGKTYCAGKSTRSHRRPFPRLPFRLYYRWPAGLAYAVGLPWPTGRREAA